MSARPSFGWDSDWLDVAKSSIARSHRATTSSRHPGRVFAGTVRRDRNAAPVTVRALCVCGLSKTQCSCGEWVCNATGHAKHACGGAP